MVFMLKMTLINENIKKKLFHLLNSLMLWRNNQSILNTHATYRLNKIKLSYLENL